MEEEEKGESDLEYMQFIMCLQPNARGQPVPEALQHPRQVLEKEQKQKVAFFFLQNMGWGN